MKLKIKEWEDLDGKTINGNKFAVSEKYIEINFDRNPSVGMIINISMKRSDIIAHLSLLGIEVEFDEEITITENDHNWLIAMEFDDCHLLSRHCKGSNIFYGYFEIEYTSHLLTSLEINKGYSISDLLKMKVEVQDAND
jgi:hypothetical protein